MDPRLLAFLTVAILTTVLFWLAVTAVIWVPFLILWSPFLVAVALVVYFTPLRGVVYKVYLQAYDWLFYKSSVARKLLWQGFYDFASWYHQDPELTCLNYGYALLNEDGKTLDFMKDHSEIFPIQLYHAVFQGRAKEVKAKKIVEVGAGRGGGLNFVAKHMEPAQAVGVDLSSSNVTFASNTFRDQKNLMFVNGDAENLLGVEGFDKDSFDFALNVESSHCYPNIDAFFAGVRDLLKPDGRFFFTDFRDREGIKQLEQQLNRFFEVEKREDITKNVLHALKLDNQRRLKLIYARAPRVLVPLMRKFAGVEGSRMFQEFESNESLYIAYVLKKKKQD